MLDLISYACRLFFNDTATTEIYTLSLHDALPIYLLGPRPRVLAEGARDSGRRSRRQGEGDREPCIDGGRREDRRSEEHTSELQSRQYLVCRLLLDKNINSQTRQYHVLSPLLQKQS